MSAPADQRIYCHRCGRSTVWESLRGSSTVERCTGCGDRFPCGHACQHLDCARAKGVEAVVRTPAELAVDRALRVARSELVDLAVHDARALLGDVVSLSCDPAWLSLDYEQQDALLASAVPEGASR